MGKALLLRALQWAPDSQAAEPSGAHSAFLEKSWLDGLEVDTPGPAWRFWEEPALRLLRNRLWAAGFRGLAWLWLAQGEMNAPLLSSLGKSKALCELRRLEPSPHKDYSHLQGVPEETRQECPQENQPP